MKKVLCVLGHVTVYLAVFSVAVVLGLLILCTQFIEVR